MCDNKACETAIPNTNITHGADFVPAIKYIGRNKEKLQLCRSDFVLQYPAPLTQL